MAEPLDVASFMQAAHDLEWVAARLTGVLKLGQEIRKLGGIVNIANEIKASIEQLRQEERDLQASIDAQAKAAAGDISAQKIQAEADRAAARQLAAAEIADRHAMADREIAAKCNAAESIHTAATQEAEQTRAQGAREAQELLDQAKGEAQKHTEAAEAAKAEHAHLVEKIAWAAAEHSATVEAKQAMQSEYNLLKVELAALKARLGL